MADDLINSDTPERTAARAWVEQQIKKAAPASAAPTPARVDEGSFTNDVRALGNYAAGTVTGAVSLGAGAAGFPEASQRLRETALQQFNQGDQSKGVILPAAKAGVSELRGLGDYAVAAGAGLAGSNATRDEYIRAAQQRFQEAQQQGVEAYERVPLVDPNWRLSDLPKQIIYQGVKTLPMTILTGGAGGVAGRALEKAGVDLLPKFGAEYAGRAATKLGATPAIGQTTEQLGQQAARNVAGTTAANYPLSVGSVYSEEVEKGDRSPQASLVSMAIGGPHAMVEAFEIGQIKNLFGRGMPSATTKKGLLNWMKGAATAGIEAGVGEGAGEGVQTFGEQLVRSDLTFAQRAQNIAAGAIMGSLGGVGMGAMAHTGGTLMPLQNVRPDQASNEALNTAVDTALNPQSAQQKLDAAVEASTDSRAAPAPERQEPTIGPNSGMRPGAPGPGEVAVEVSPEDRIQGGVEPMQAPVAPIVAEQPAPMAAQPRERTQIPQVEQPSLSTARSSVVRENEPYSHVETSVLQNQLQQPQTPEAQKTLINEELALRDRMSQSGAAYVAPETQAREDLRKMLGMTNMPESYKEEIRHPLEAYGILQAKLADAAEKGRLGNIRLNQVEKKLIQHYGLMDRNNQPVSTESLQQRADIHQALAADETSDPETRANEAKYAEQLQGIINNRAQAEQYAEDMRQRATEQPTVAEAAPESEEDVLHRAAMDAVEGANLKTQKTRRSYLAAFKDGARGGENNYSTKENKAAYAAGQEYAASRPAPTEAPAPAAPEPTAAPVTFKTALGSTYTVGEDGTTIRNKAPRPEHPGEQGIQPQSQRTVYMTDEEMNKLAEIQAEGGARKTLTFDDASRSVAIKYLSGKDAGKIERRTVAKFETQPQVGLSPVEFFGDDRTVHFGNKITEVGGGAASTTENPSAVQEQGPEGVYVQPTPEAGGTMGEGNAEGSEAPGARVEGAPEVTERPVRFETREEAAGSVTDILAPADAERGYGGTSALDKRMTRLLDRWQRIETYATTLWHQRERFEKVVPSLKQLSEADIQRDGFSSQLIQFVADTMDRADMMLRQNARDADRVLKIMSEARYGIDANKLWAEHTWLRDLPDVDKYKERHAAVRQKLHDLRRSGREGILREFNDINNLMWKLLNIGLLNEKLKSIFEAYPDIAPAFAQRLQRLDPMLNYIDSSDTGDLHATAGHFDKTYNGLKTLAEDYVRRYPDDADTQLVQNLLNDMAAQEVENQKAPYYHLGRTGDQMLKFEIVKDADGLVNKEAAEAIVSALEDAGHTGYEITPLGTDGRVFMMFTDASQRRNAAGIIQEMVNDGHVQRGTNEDGYLAKNPALNQAPRIVQELIDSLRAEGDENSGALINSLKKAANEMLPEADARRSLIRRKNIEGFSKNMIGNMSRDLDGKIRLISRMLATPHVRDAMNVMRAQEQAAKSPDSPDYANRDLISHIYRNRRAAEAVEGMRANVPLINRMITGNFLFRMGGRVGTAILQYLQVPHIFLPRVAAVEGVGYRKAGQSLFRATPLANEIMRAAISEVVQKQSYKSWFDAPIATNAIQASSVSDTVKQFLTLYNNRYGLSIHSLAQELNHLNTVHEFGDTAGSRVAGAYDMFQKMSTSMVYYSETYSRVLAALMAYEAYPGEKTSAEGMRKAVEFAGKMSADGMFLYSAGNRSVMSRNFMGLGPQASTLMFALKSYSMMANELMVRNLGRSLGVDNYASPEQQREARRFMAGFTATTILLAGALGLPAINALAPLLDMLGDWWDPEDEPHDIRVAMIKFLGDASGQVMDNATAEQVTRLILEGLPASLGANIQNNIGMQDLVPFTRTVIDNPKPLKDRLEAVLKETEGSPTTLLVDILDGIGKIAEGVRADDPELIKEGQMAIGSTPAKSLVAGWKMLQDGKFRDEKGNILPIKDATVRDALVKFMVLTPTPLAEYRMERGAMERREAPLRQDTARLVNRLAQAIQNGDTESVDKYTADAEKLDPDVASDILKRAERLAKRRQTDLEAAEEEGLPLRAPKKDTGLSGAMSGFSVLRGAQ